MGKGGKRLKPTSCFRSDLWGEEEGGAGDWSPPRWSAEIPVRDCPVESVRFPLGE